MATLKTITTKELSEARKGGFNRKKPKRPKQSSSLTSLESYIDRYNKYVDDAKAKAKEHREREQLKKKIFK